MLHPKTIKHKASDCAKTISYLILIFFISVSMQVSAATVTAGQKQVAKVNGTVLTEADLQEALNEIMPASVFHGGFSSEKRASYRPQAFEKMIEKELLFQAAIKKEIKVNKKAIKKKKDRTIKRLGGKKKFRMALKKAGLTENQYEKILKKKQLIKQITTLEITNKAKASDQEIKTYYKKNKDKLVRPEARRIRHILIAVKPSATAAEKKLKREKASEVIAKIKAGEEMSKVAWTYSDDRYKVKGGDLGLVHRGRLDPSLEKEVFKLEPNRLSNIIETRFGFHIVRVEEVKPPEQLSLEDASPKIKKQLTDKKAEQIRKKLISRLKSQAQIEAY